MKVLGDDPLLISPILAHLRLMFLDIETSRLIYTAIKQTNIFKTLILRNICK